MKGILSLIILLSVVANNVSAEILECRLLDDIKIGGLFAKYKNLKLRSNDGTVYEKGGTNIKNNTTLYLAVTKLGIEKAWLANEPIRQEGLEYYPMTITVDFHNGMSRERELVCFDAIKANKHRRSIGEEPIPITVPDF